MWLDDFSYFIGLIGPLILSGAIFLLILRALLHHSRYRAAKTFSAADQESVRRAIVAAERQTIGEIIPVILETSDPHPAAKWRAAISFVIVGSTLMVHQLPWTHPGLVFVSQIVMGMMGYAIAYSLPDFKRVFIPERRATAVAQEQALQEFYGQGLHQTEAATGVLLFVSLLERRVIVLADEGINAKVDPERWNECKKLVLDGIRENSLANGLNKAISAISILLAEYFPWVDDDRNEVPDRVIVRPS